MRFPKRKDVKLQFFLSSLILFLILIKGILELNRSEEADFCNLFYFWPWFEI